MRLLNESVKGKAEAFQKSTNIWEKGLAIVHFDETDFCHHSHGMRLQRSYATAKHLQFGALDIDFDEFPYVGASRRCNAVKSLRANRQLTHDVKARHCISTCEARRRCKEGAIYAGARQMKLARATGPEDNR